MGKVFQNTLNDGREVLLDGLYFALSNIYHSFILDIVQCTKYLGNYSYQTLKWDQWKWHSEMSVIFWKQQHKWPVSGILTFVFADAHYVISWPRKAIIQ